MSTYTAVQPVRRRRSLLQRTPWRGLVWLGGTAGATGLLAAQPETQPANLPLTVVAYAMLLGAALVQPRRRTP